MSIQSAYRGMPTYFAVPLAVLASAAVASALAALGVFTLDFLLKKFDGPEGPGAGVLVILVALNIAVSAFIAVVSILVNLHHRTSWPTPTFAFAFCIVLVRMMGPFDVQFAPFMLGTGATVWLVSCWFLRRKGVSSPEHVIEA
jgi:hypothetical protein